MDKSILFFDWILKNVVSWPTSLHLPHISILFIFWLHLSDSTTDWTRHKWTRMGEKRTNNLFRNCKNLIDGVSLLAYKWLFCCCCSCFCGTERNLIKPQNCEILIFFFVLFSGEFSLQSTVYQLRIIELHAVSHLIIGFFFWFEKSGWPEKESEFAEPLF